jgi:hypothetical protein
MAERDLPKSTCRRGVRFRRSLRCVALDRDAMRAAGGHQRIEHLLHAPGGYQPHRRENDLLGNVSATTDCWASAGCSGSS